MIKVLTVFGTRPEGIKMAPLVKALNDDPAFENIVCVTAQHRQMLDQVLDLFDIIPDIDLDLMRPGQDLNDLTSNILLEIKNVLERTKPDLVLVQGDTTTTFVTALASFYANIPVGHVEAGLRTGNISSPFPEEANRCMTSKLAALHFCPTQKNFDNLVSEGIKKNYIWVTGNTVVDSLLQVTKIVKNTSSKKWEKYFGNKLRNIIEERDIVLITGHRRENFGKGFQNICQAIENMAKRNKSWDFIYPVHLNPNVSSIVHEKLSGIPNVHLIKPLDYVPFIFLLNNSKIILTDSGGIQEEAPALGKPVLVMRETTERQEGVAAGTVKLVGTNTEQIVSSVEMLINDKELYQKMSLATNPYGDGKTAQRIVKAIKEWK